MSAEKNNPNRGKVIYYQDEKHFIVYEMNNNNILITKDKTLKTGIFSVNKTKTSVKPKK